MKKLKNLNFQKLWKLDDFTFNEFVVWGEAPNNPGVEVLLCANINNEKIKSLELAQKIQKILEDKGCKNCRIQHL